MNRYLKLFLKILAISVTAIVAAVLLVFALLNTSLNKKIVARIVPEFIDGQVDYTRLRIHLLPRISLDINDFVLTSDQDTIASFSNLRARVKTFPLLRGRIRIPEVTINDLYADLWKDENGRANWDIFKSDSEGDTVTKAFSAPDLALERLFVNGRIAYAVPSYAVMVNLDSLSLEGVGKDLYKAVLDSRINVRTASIDNLELPFGIDGHIGYAIDSSSLSINLDSLDINLAYIPLGINGLVIKNTGGFDLDLNAGVQQFDLNTILDRFANEFVPEYADKITAGDFSLNINVKGRYDDNSWPAFDGELATELLGADIRLSGKVANLTARKPCLEAHGTISASVDSFMRFVPDSMALKATGGLRIAFDKPYSSDQRFTLTADSDSLFVKYGDDIEARLKAMSNKVTVTYVKNHFGRRVPKLEVSTQNSRIRVMYDGNRISLRDLGLTASVRKIKMDTSAVKRFRKRAPRPAKDSIPDFLSEKDFEKSDISVSMDSTISKFLQSWSPAGEISLRRGSVASPKFPLKVRITGIEGKFDSNEMDLNYFGISAGRSDLSVDGSLSGYRKMLHGGKSLLSLNMDVYSKKLNVNELMAAIQAGKDTSFVDNGDIQDESFAADTLSEAQIEKAPTPLVVIPANLIANVNLNADSVKVANLEVTPMEASLRVRERTLQLLSSKLATSVGKLEMDAYYSTRTKENISAGLNVEASDISAAGIIDILPAVDSLFPILNAFDGNMNAKLTATTQIDTNMNVIKPSLNAMFKIYGKDLNISDAGDLKKVTRLLMFRNPNIGKIQDMSVGGIIQDSKIEIYPFVLGIDRYRIALSGIQGFDGSMNYHASILRSPIFIRFGVDIKGTTDKWKWRLCRARYKSSYAPIYSQRIDTMQFNLASSIRSVYKYGVKKIENAVVNDAQKISAQRNADDSLQMKMIADTTAAPELMSAEAIQSSFNEESQQRIELLRSKTEQHAVTRRKEQVKTTR